MDSYLGELRVHWRPLAAAVIGLSTGLIMVSYVIGIMGQYLVDEFHWPKEDMALVGVLALAAVLIIPFTGRSADVFGVRNTAMVGVIAAPISFLMLSRISTLTEYAIMYAIQAGILATTTPPVYNRVVVQYFKRSRGLALGICAAAPAMAIALGGPLLNNFVVDHGWRAGYVAMAVYTAIAGLTALVLLPPEVRSTQSKAVKQKRAKDDYAMIFRSGTFWIIAIGVLLCTLPNSVIQSQLALILSENGASGKAASLMISGYASGMIAGRLLSGIALDRFPAKYIATASIAMAGCGLLILASGFDSRAAVFAAVLISGLSFGAESDVIAYIIVSNFGARIYSTVHSITATGTAMASVIGAGLLTVLLKRTGVYAPFLGLTGAIAIGASLLFLLVPRHPKVIDSHEHAAPGAEQEPTAQPAPATL